MENISENKLVDHKPLPNILIVDDTPANVLLLEKMLTERGYRTRQVSNGKQALEAASAEPPDLIMLDVNMPEMNEYEVCEQLKADAAMKDIPVIFISTSGEMIDKIKAFAVGGVDYVTKPFHFKEVEARLHAHLKLRRLQIEVEMQNEELRRVQKELDASQARYFNFYDMSPAGYCTVNENGLVLEANPSASSMLGVEHGALIRQPITRFILKEDHDIYCQLNKKLFASLSSEQVGQAGAPQMCELRIIRPDGTPLWVWVDAIAVYEKVSGEPILQFTMNDIDERKQADQEKSKLELHLRESQKMDAIGQLAGGISHDFNNLLSVINGYSEMIMLEPGLKATLRSQIEEILRAGERAAGLTRQLLVFSRRQPVETRNIDLDVIISGMEKMLRRLMRENIIITRNMEAPLWQIKADPGNIEQVIMNLVINASDAMPDGGTITIDTENVKIDETDRLDYPPDIKPGPYVMLSVGDTGCGMDDKVREQIFEPFFTTKEVGKGTGLGLATVYGIVKQGNAHIDVQSELGKGTKFRIYFPQVAGEGIAKEEQPTVSMPQGSETILLVEDEESYRRMLHYYLQSIGYNVLTACNGKEALELAEKHKGEIHLLFTDVVMPGMNGFELAKNLKNSFPEIKLLFMSGYTKEADIRKMMDMNGELMGKPISIYALSVKLREILEKELLKV